jgi:hypothetical protein
VQSLTYRSGELIHMRKAICTAVLFTGAAIMIVGCGSDPVKSTEKLPDSVEVKTKIKGNMVKDELPTLPDNMRK